MPLNEIEETEPTNDGEVDLSDYLRSIGITDGRVGDEHDVKNPSSIRSLNDGLLSRAGSSADSKYNPRSLSLVSTLKGQFLGTCWVYGTYAAIESNLIKKGLASTNIDLSELQAL